MQSSYKLNRAHVVQGDKVILDGVALLLRVMTDSCCRRMQTHGRPSRAFPFACCRRSRSRTNR